ncbi:hypothetical protein MMC34_005674 [Xylographa carneopallida]|nr:hypothetical protein [Xylographa carneopallida]
MGSNISTASSIVGFVSFAFTFFTFIRVTEGAIMTVFSAPTEAKDYFGNLRQELWELREDLRKASRRNRPRRGSDHKGSGSSLESGSLRVLQDTVKRIQRDFRVLERPFLLDPERDDPDIDSAWAHYNLRTNYCDMDLSHRIRWLRSKSRIVNMAQEVSRIMVRRINAEVNSILISMQDMERSRQQTLDQIRNMQDRLHDRSDDDGTYARRRN